MCETKLSFPIFKVIARSQDPSFSFHLLALIDLFLLSEPGELFAQPYD